MNSWKEPDRTAANAVGRAIAECQRAFEFLAICQANDTRDEVAFAIGVMLETIEGEFLKAARAMTPGGIKPDRPVDQHWLEQKGFLLDDSKVRLYRLSFIDADGDPAVLEVDIDDSGAMLSCCGSEWVTLPFDTQGQAERVLSVLGVNQ